MQPEPVGPARGPFFWPGPSLNRLGVDRVAKVFSVGEITLLVAPPWRVHGAVQRRRGYAGVEEGAVEAHGGGMADGNCGSE